MSTETHRKKIWDIPKPQKAFKPLQEDEIKWLADRINSGNSTPQDLHARYGIHIRKLQRIAKNEREGVPNRVTAGRPAVSSDKAQGKLKSDCAPGNVQVSEQEYKKLQNESLKESLIEHNILPPDVVRVCPKTIRAWD